MDDAQLSSWGMRRLFLVSVLIGMLTGVAAWAFRQLIGVVHNLAFFGRFAFAYDANQHTPPAAWGWLVIFVPVLGGLVVVWLVKNFAPEAKGHGVPEVMNAIYHQRGRIRGVVSLVKALASAITIGTGGSLGREGPIVQISSAMSSVMAQWLRLSVPQRNLLIACGASGGIAATFNAPIGGILFSVELLLLSVNSSTLLPVVTSAVIAANVGRYLIGPEPAFYVPALEVPTDLGNPLVLALYFPFAAVTAVVGWLFIKSIYASEDWFDKLPGGPYARHALGMLGVGVLMYAFHRLTGHYYVQGIGYAAVQDVLNGAITNPWLILALLAGKLLATSLTVGSGGSGGVFSPSLYLGVMVGGFFGTALAALLPELGIDQVTFALVGMASMVAATTSAPMTAALMTYEMTLDYTVVLPVMVGVSVAYSVRYFLSPEDIYTLKLVRRGLSVPRGFHADFYSQITVDDIMDKEVEFARAGQRVKGGEHAICVLDGEDRVIGVVNPVSYRRNVEFYPEHAMLTDFIVVAPNVSLYDALREIDAHDSNLAVVSTSGELDKQSVAGVFSAAHVAHAIADASRILIA